MKVSFLGWQQYLSRADLHRTDVEWIGLIERPSGERGALCRVRANGLLMQANRAMFQTLDQSTAEAALNVATLEVMQGSSETA